MNKINILIAFPYFKKDLIDYLIEQDKNSYRLIVDSGAFTAWNLGKKIELDDYCFFLDSIERLRPFNAVQLDVFGQPDPSYQNLKKMVERGYDVMPVFTRGESLERLEEFYTLSDYLMFGGIVTGGSNKNYVKWFLNQNKQRKTHWLGFVNIPFIKHYKPFSVDSSGWKGAARFGNISLYVGGGTMKTISRVDFSKKPDQKTVELFHRLGVSTNQIKNLAKDASWRGTGESEGGAQFITTISHVKRAFDVERNLGTRIYLAVSSLWELKQLFKARSILKGVSHVRDNSLECTT